MDYSKIYASLVERAKNRKTEGYVEKHHIVPKCLGGSDKKENIVSLTAREHFVCHQLLTRIHPGVRGLSWAALLMTGKDRFNPGYSKKYAFLKKAAAADIAKQNSGKRMRPLTEKQVRQYAARVGISLPSEVREKISRIHKGRAVSAETREKIRQAAKKRAPFSEERKDAIRQFMKGNKFRKGIPNTPEMKQKLREAHLGRVQSQQEKDKRAASRRRITDEQVRAVRNSAGTYDEISVRTGVSRTQVGRIRRGEMYSEVV